ncbi:MULTISPECIES: hypothetical protein [unclassified Moorena]|uniref:hypothetical protein n=1 Tax=unclassified Moorena TaxID=2683338 RepID=UPI0013C10A09|nr:MULTISPECIES: hypothetical protein [unclassified Moorena]NEO05822.1 hypothetical protein [Moorena sp. SIO3I8]NEO20228.1 hypothetical protein [Moorena sp. SIO4A5]NEP22676.1 hypothetical protein [Moorena sp. SIO3I6]
MIFSPRAPAPHSLFNPKCKKPTPTPYSLLPTPYSLLPTPYSLLPVPFGKLTINKLSSADPDASLPGLPMTEFGL